MIYSSFDAEVFVLRRAWMVGLCCRADIERAYATHRSPAKTAAIMADAVRAWPEHLHWEKRVGVRPITSAATPTQACAQHIFDLIAQGEPAPVTGVFDDDGAGILRPKLLASRAMTPSATQVVLQSAMQNLPVRVLYTGLRKGAAARWRRLIPSAMEFTGAHWRLHAQDMDDPGQVDEQGGIAGPAIKVFLLSRILDAQPLHERDVPKGFKRRMLVQTHRRLRVHLSEDLTPEQVAAVKNSLDIAPDGTMQWPTHSLYEFKRDYAGAPLSSDAVWPLLSRVDELD